MRGTKLRMPLTTPSRHTLSTHSQSSRLISHCLPIVDTPALLTITCTPPNRSTVAVGERVDRVGVAHVDDARHAVHSRAGEFRFCGGEPRRVDVGEHDAHARRTERVGQRVAPTRRPPP